MHTERTGRTPHETVEVYDVDRCAGCQGPLAHPHAIMGHQPCSCVPGGHRSWFCFGCRRWTYDPPHDETVRPLVGGSGYFGGDVERLSPEVEAYHRDLAAAAQQVLDEFGMDEFDVDERPEVDAALVARSNEVRRRYGAPLIPGLRD